MLKFTWKLISSLNGNFIFVSCLGNRYGKETIKSELFGWDSNSFLIMFFHDSFHTY